MTQSTYLAGERPLAAHRWFVKKAARTALTAASALPAVLGFFDSRPGIRVLTYHRFGDDPRAPFTVSGAAFDRQMGALARAGNAVSLADLEAFLAGRGDLPRNAILVTIDDGDPSVLHVALPILQKHRIPAVLFALGGTPDGYPVMSAAELRMVAEAGVTVGSHSVNHLSIAQLPLAAMRREALDSRQRLEEVLGRPVTSFAYPFGTRADYSDQAAGVLREAGYTTAFTSQHGPVRGGMDPMLLPRVKVEGGDPAWHFDLLCRGGMDGWRLVDATLHRVQRPAA